MVYSSISDTSHVVRMYAYCTLISDNGTSQDESDILLESTSKSDITQKTGMLKSEYFN